MCWAACSGWPRRLFDIRITERETVFIEVGKHGRREQRAAAEPGPVEVWHPEVKFYEVRNGSGTHIGSFYADWHPRDSKRGGAWMNYLKGGSPGDGGATAGRISASSAAT